MLQISKLFSKHCKLCRRRVVTRDEAVIIINCVDVASLHGTKQ